MIIVRVVPGAGSLRGWLTGTEVNSYNRASFRLGPLGILPIGLAHRDVVWCVRVNILSDVVYTVESKCKQQSQEMLNYRL